MANEKFKDKIIKVFGMEMDDDDQYYDDEYYDDEVEEAAEEEPVRSTGFSASKPKKAPRRQAAASMGLDGPEVLVLDPERFEDAPGIVKKIKADKTVVVNLKNTEYEDGRKIFDFLNGAVFALDGSINKIAENVFILAPREVSVSTSMEKEEAEDVMPILNWDDEN
ncbi:MAG: cell division protein SepF [Eubacterium sp.]|nr:cell division protein SepF [Eubacterium sp.]